MNNYMSFFEIALLVLGICAVVVFGVALLIHFLDRKENRKVVIYADELYRGRTLVSTTYNTYQGKELIKSETITY